MFVLEPVCSTTPDDIRSGFIGIQGRTIKNYDIGTTTGVTSGAGTAYPSRAPGFIPQFLVGFVLLDLSFYMYVLLIVVCPFVLFSVGHCVVCSSIYGL